MITKGTLVRFNESGLNFLKFNNPNSSHESSSITKIIGYDTNPLYWRGVVHQIDILNTGIMTLTVRTTWPYQNSSMFTANVTYFISTKDVLLSRDPELLKRLNEARKESKVFKTKEIDTFYDEILF